MQFSKLTQQIVLHVNLVVPPLGGTGYTAVCIIRRVGGASGRGVYAYNYGAVREIRQYTRVPEV